MNCSQCGSSASDDAKFCGNCGSPLAKRELAVESTAPADAKSPVKGRIIWVFVFGFIQFLVLTSMFLPAFAGRPQIPQAGNGSMWATGLLGFFLSRYLGKRGWVGAIIGGLLGIFIFALAAFVGGYVAHSRAV